MLVRRHMLSSSNSTPRYMPSENAYICTPKSVFKNVQGITTWNNQKPIMQMSTNIKCLKILWHIFTIEHSSATQRAKLIYTTTYILMSLIVVLSERSQTNKARYDSISTKFKSRRNEPTELEGRMVTFDWGGN